MKKAMIGFFVLAAVVAFAGPGIAQTDCRQGEVLMAVSTKHATFLPPSALQPADIVVRLNGKPVPVSRIDPEEKTSVVIIMDASGSMVDGSGMELDLARKLVEALPPDQPQALIAFARQSVVLARNHDEVVRQLQRITSFKEGKQPRTALWDAIDRALTVSSSRRAIFVLLSDGGDNASALDADVVKKRLQQSGVRMIWINTRSGECRAPEECLGGDITAQIATSTGGLAIWPENLRVPLAHVPPMVISGRPFDPAKLVAAAVGAYSRVHFELPGNIPQNAKLKISLARKPEYKGTRLTYPERLRECSAQQH